MLDFSNGFGVLAVKSRIKFLGFLKLLSEKLLVAEKRVLFHPENFHSTSAEFLLPKDIQLLMAIFSLFSRPSFEI